MVAAASLGIYAALGSHSNPPAVDRARAARVAVGCRMANVSVRVLPMSNPTGLDRLLVKLTNRGSSPCVVSGYPVLKFYDRTRQIPFLYDRDGKVKAVSVGPNRSAYAVFSKFRCDIGVSRSATRGTFGLTRGAPTASFVGGPAICKPGIPAEARTVLVYPFEPTQRLAYMTSLAQS